jgi:hypothetical protein
MTAAGNATRRTAVVLFLLPLLIGARAGAQDMPDPSQIHGRAIPAAELPTGTVTVRVVREAIGNNIGGQPVSVLVQGRTYTATTDDLGRAEFRDLPRGSEARAETTVEGEALVSEPFPVPSAGGLRVILIANIAGAAERRQQEEATALAAPPVQGLVVLGGDSRIVTEFQSDTLRVFYRLDIINSARTRVDIGRPLILDLPTGAAGAALGTAPKSATINGTRVTVVGPFDPGTTTVEVSYQLEHDSPDLTLSQTWPAPLQQWLVGVERVGQMTVTSPQFQGTEERAAENGSVYVVGSGQPIAEGSALTLQFSNLPVHSRLASRVAIGLALAIIGFGAWLAFTGAPGRQGMQALMKRRDTLLAKLADLDASRQDGRIPDERYLPRRQRLLRDLEEIYAAIEEADHPRGGGEGVAA